jgi:hypothetical protein
MLRLKKISDLRPLGKAAAETVKMIREPRDAAREIRVSQEYLNSKIRF